MVVEVAQTSYQPTQAPRDPGIDCVDNRFLGSQPYPRTRLAKKRDGTPE
jgi:hypothetical protein